MGSLREECGVFGIFSPEKQDLAAKAYYGLFALQHRGQESCGIVVGDDGLFRAYKDTGLVGEVFTFKGMAEHTGLTDEELRAVRWDVLYPKYQINAELLAKAKPNVGVMHCMPGNRDEEITSEVWDGPNSLLFEEAENRLHAQKGICTWLMYDGKPSPELVAYHTARVEAALKDSMAY